MVNKEDAIPIPSHDENGVMEWESFNAYQGTAYH